MKLIEYAENCYRANHYQQTVCTYPKGCLIETKALADGVNSSVITRYALEKYASVMDMTCTANCRY